MPYDKGKSGISNYLEQIVPHLSKKVSLDCLITKEDYKNFPKENLKDTQIIHPLFSLLISRPTINTIFHTLFIPIWLLFKKYDLVILPAANRRTFLFYPLLTIGTIHDFSQLHVQEKYDFLRMIYVKKILPLLLNKINYISCPSKSTIRDTANHLRFNEKKLIHNPNGFSIVEKQINKISTSIINSKYLLFVSRLEHPGKNHINLIKAFIKLSPQIAHDWKLVLAGAEWNGSDQIYQYVNSIDVKYKEKIIFTGFLNTENLENIYSNANLFIYPSLYEGFGIPVLDAMSRGLPVLCSNTSSLPEVGGDAACYFNPTDPSDITDKIAQVISSVDLQKIMIHKGHINTKKYKWAAHVDKLLNIINPD
ncbi:MAG: glycosyltransferase family 4 protein [Bdellovibrionales bacterium]|jgi:glycosyltransferase involved in cell wall biosynthesis|nr:glycosyltransferase family 4 protein [Bdellovibrionales bacterium]